MSRPRRRCVWYLMPHDPALWWEARCGRWVAGLWRPGLSNLRELRTRTAACRASWGLAALGGGCLYREFRGRRPTRMEWEIFPLA